MGAKQQLNADFFRLRPIEISLLELTKTSISDPGLLIELCREIYIDTAALCLIATLAQPIYLSWIPIRSERFERLKLTGKEMRDARRQDLRHAPAASERRRTESQVIPP